MLTYILKDTEGNVTSLNAPLKVSIVSSENAPADRLNAVFAVSGDIPVLYSVEVKNGGERVFFGYIDEQSDEKSSKGILLSVSARSLEGVLLDNEAHPQIYCSPSMPLLMKRHFEPLGFTEFNGTDKSFNGQLNVTKGMSEWSVLSAFCKYFIGTEPEIDKYGVIDISGRENDEVVYLSSDRIYSVKHELKNTVLISEILARTYIAGDYTMPVINETAKRVKVRRRRYVNSVDSKSGTVLDARRMIERSEKAYERITVGCTGCILCGTGAGLIISGDRRKYRIREISYMLDTSGERTIIYAEVKNDEAV